MDRSPRTSRAALELPTGSEVSSTTTRTRKPGRLLLDVSQLSAYECESSPLVVWWLTVDGVAVPSSALRTREEVWATLKRLSGVTDHVVPAGEHEIATWAGCSSGAVTGGHVFTDMYGTVTVLRSGYRP